MLIQRSEETFNYNTRSFFPLQVSILKWTAFCH